MTRTATKRRDFGERPTLAGSAAKVLWELSEPVEFGSNRTTKFFITSAVASRFMVETYIFPATEDGTIIDWLELDGSLKGTTDHRAAIRAAGFEVVE